MSEGDSDRCESHRPPDDKTFALRRFREAYDVVREAGARLLYRRTPLVSHWTDVGDLSALSRECDLHLKLENVQVTGSYKVRGVLNQVHHFLREQQHQSCKCDRNAISGVGHSVPDGISSEPRCPRHNPIGLVTMSAGNYGKAFAFVTAAADANGGGSRNEVEGNEDRVKIGGRLVVMPSSAPVNRQTVIESMGADVHRAPTSELVGVVDGLLAGGSYYHMQSIDDDHLILGHGSLGLEILEDLPDPDIVLVPCGGGALLAGVAASIKLSLGDRLNKCRVYGIEPEGANTMWQSFRAGRPVSMPTAHSIASGLAPPYAGNAAYRLCRRYVDDVILVSDSLIARAVTQFYNQGLVVEPSGAVGYAALSEELVPDVVGRKVVVVVSGGNVTADEMAKLFEKS